MLGELLLYSRVFSDQLQTGFVLASDRLCRPVFFTVPGIFCGCVCGSCEIDGVKEVGRF